MIYRNYMPYIDTFLNTIGIIDKNILLIGVHKMKGAGLFSKHLLDNGARSVTTLDLFDPAADLQLDLNQPLNLEHQYDALIDIGSIEHVFDTRQVLINYLQAVELGGYIAIHTPVGGYYGHGMYTFNPRTIVDALEINGCVILSEDYSGGNRTRNEDTNLWVIALKNNEYDEFICPQEGQWEVMYG